MQANSQTVVKDLMLWECFSQENLKNWLLKTWLSHIKRWCLVFRLNDLLFCNTDNGNERLNEDLKYVKIKGLKQSYSSEVLVMLILRKHYKSITKNINSLKFVRAMVSKDMLLTFPIF